MASVCHKAITLPPFLKFSIALCILVIAGAVAWYVPPDMDTFIQFQPIACALFLHPPPCGAWDLTVGGFIPWPRSWDFQGLGLYSFVYYPLYSLFPFWQSALVINALWMIGTVWFFIRLTRCNPWIAAFVYGANFFFVYNLLHDYQTGYHTALFCAVPWLVLHILNAKTGNKKLLLNLLLGTVVFLGIEYKAVFLYYIPGAFLLVHAFHSTRMPLIRLVKVLLWECLPAILMVVTFSLFISFAQLPDGQPYWKLLQTMQRHYPHFDSLVAYLQHLKGLIVAYLLNFPNSGGITYGPLRDLPLVNAPADYKGMLITAPFWIITVGFYAAFLLHKPPTTDTRYYFYRRIVLALSVVSIVTLLIVATNTKVRHAFHLMTIMVCLLGGLTLSMDYYISIRRTRAAWIGAILAFSQTFCTIWVVSQKPLIHYSWDRMHAIAYASRSEISHRAVIVNMNWGTYFISTLYIPNAQSIFSGGYLRHRKELLNLRDETHNQGRHLVFIKRSGANTTFEMIRSELPSLRKAYPPEGTPSEWEVWSE